MTSCLHDLTSRIAEWDGALSVLMRSSDVDPMIARMIEAVRREMRRAVAEINTGQPSPANGVAVNAGPVSPKNLSGHINEARDDMRRAVAGISTNGSTPGAPIPVNRARPIPSKELRDRLKHVRNAAGLNDRELGDVMGCTPGNVSHLLLGTTKKLRADFANNLEAATGYSARWLTEGKGAAKEAVSEFR